MVDRRGPGLTTDPVQAEPSFSVERLLDSRAARSALFAAPLVPLLVAFVRKLVVASHPIPVVGDQAAQVFNTGSAESFQLLVGSYSRYGWHHPGPFMSYWYSLFARVFGLGAGATVLGTVTLNLIGIAVISFGIARFGTRSQRIIGSAALTFFVFQFGMDRLVDPWNPFTIIVPLAVAAFACALVLTGRIRWLPVVAAAASIAAQDHLGAVPLAALWTLVALVGAGVVCRRRLREVAIPVGVALGVIVVLWIPPLYQQVRYPPGNLHEIIHFSQQDHEKPKAPETRDNLVVPLTLTHRPLGDAVGYSIKPLPVPAPWQVRLSQSYGILLLVGVALPTAGLAGGRWRRAMCLVAVIGVVGVYESSMRAIPPLYGYLYTPAVAVGLVALMGVAFSVVDLAVLLARRRHTIGPLVLRSAAVAAIAVIAALTVVSTASATSTRGYGDEVGSGAVVGLADAIQAAAPCGARSVFLQFVPDGYWVYGIGAALVLQRRGVHVHVAVGDELFFGPGHSATGTESARLVAVANGTRPPSDAVRVVPVGPPLGGSIVVAPIKPGAPVRASCGMR
ncbi:MAG: hypothetical protein JST73_07300 [Actinobacteria bacterium]|nr:hypothetical protein [Actinomycetota bacterium]